MHKTVFANSIQTASVCIIKAECGDLCFAEKCKRFLQEFYTEDGNGKKVFKYGAQLVSTANAQHMHLWQMEAFQRAPVFSSHCHYYSSLSTIICFLNQPTESFPSAVTTCLFF